MFTELMFSGGGGTKNIYGPIRLTGNDSPEGYHVTAKTVYSTSYQPYQAFNGLDTAQGYAPSSTAQDNWLKLELPDAKYAAFAFMKYGGTNTTVTVQGSNDDVNYDTLASLTSLSDLNAVFSNLCLINSGSAYKYYKFVGPFSSSGAGYKIEFYTSDSAGVGSAESMRDLIYDKVFNGGFTTTYDFIPYRDRVTINEGKIAIDTTNRVVYLYADFTLLQDLSSNTYYMLNTDPLFPSSAYNPRGQSTLSVIYPLFIDRITPVSSSATLKYDAFKFGYYSASLNGLTTNAIAVKTNERYQVYSAWQY